MFKYRKHFKSLQKAFIPNFYGSADCGPFKILERWQNSRNFLRMKCTDYIISSDPRCKYGNARLTTVDYTVQCTCVYTAQYSVLACTLHSTVYLHA